MPFNMLGVLGSVNYATEKQKARTGQIKGVCVEAQENEV